MLGHITWLMLCLHKLRQTVIEILDSLKTISILEPSACKQSTFMAGNYPESGAFARVTNNVEIQTRCHMIFIFVMFVHRALDSMPSFHAFTQATHFSREVAIMTDSSAITALMPHLSHWGHLKLLLRRGRGPQYLLAILVERNIIKQGTAHPLACNWLWSRVELNEYILLEKSYSYAI